MYMLESATRSILNILLAICVAFLCVRLCTGCAYLKEFQKEAKPAIVLALKDAYALGGATAVSNKIEQLVIDGKVTPAQATQLHILAQKVFDHAVEKLEADAFDTALEPSVAMPDATDK